MGTKSNDNLSEMLREFAHSGIVEDSFSKDFYAWNKLKKNRTWKEGAELQIPMELSENSDLEFGALVAEADIGEGSYKKIKITEQPQLFSSMVIEERDLKRYGDLKQSFLKMMPQKMSKLTRRMKHAFSAMMLRGGVLAKISSIADAATGKVVIDKPQYFTLGQRVQVNGEIVYVTKISMNEKAITLSADRAGAVIDLTAIASPVSVNDGVNIVGADTENFTSFVDYLLPAAQGGSDQLYGVLDKDTNPIATPQVFDGTGFTASTVVDKLIDIYYDVKELGKVDQAEIIVPYHIFKAFAKKIENSKQYSGSEKKAGVGYSQLVVVGPAGEMILTALPDMRDDLIFIIDWESFEFAGHRFLDRIKSPDGLEYYTVRSKTGYRFICDHVLQGDLVAKKLSSSAVVHSIPRL